MNDIDQIARHNAKAVEQGAAQAAAQGKFVVLKYSGLNFIDFLAFDTEGERNKAALDWANASPGNRTALLQPADDGGLTLADAEADINGTPRPDHRTVFDAAPSSTEAV